MKKAMWMGCAIALAAMPVLGDDNDSDSSKQHQKSSSYQSSSASSQENLQPWQKAQAAEFFRASKIIGKNAQTQDAKKIGEISDVVFNQQGELFVLVGVGKGKLAAVPWQKFDGRTAKGDQPVVIKSTLEAVASAPAVTDDQWGSINNPEFTKGIYSYYHVQPPTGMGASSSPGGQSSASQSEDSDSATSHPATTSSTSSDYSGSSLSSTSTNSTSSAQGGTSEASESQSSSGSDSSSKPSEDKSSDKPE